MSALSLASYLGRTKNRVFRVGVELEGGWLKLPEGVSGLATDGSVNVSAYHMVLDPMNPGKVKREVLNLNRGELISPIISPDENGKWSLLHSYLRENYPSHVNESCGLHVHMSFESARHYDLLLTRDYQDTIVDCLRQWATSKQLNEKHAIWPRLRGENTYCKLDYYGDAQAAAERKNYDHARHGSRYTAINYAYGQHSTVECRILPMFDKADEAVEAVQHVIDITNACLVRLRRKEEHYKTEIPLNAVPEIGERAIVIVEPEVLPTTVEETFICNGN